MNKTPPTEMSLMTHLAELRSRLIKSLLAVGGGMAISLTFSEQIFTFLSAPLVQVLPETDRQLVFTSLPEVFFVYFKVAIFSGILIASPVIFYQIWRFIEPALYAHERRTAIPFVFTSTLFFFIGAGFCYYQVFPLGFRFFIGLSSEHIKPMLSMKEYLKFATTLLLVFGLIFEMPVLLSFLAGLGIVSASFLRKQRKYAIVIIFIIAAILTPPDVVTQVMMALPMIMLYEISILGAAFFGKPRTLRRKTEIE